MVLAFLKFNCCILHSIHYYKYLIFEKYNFCIKTFQSSTFCAKSRERYIHNIFLKNVIILFYVFVGRLIFDIVKKLGRQVQLGPRYEGQLNPMAEPIPHEVRPLVRTHVYHPYHAADRQAETDS